VEKLIILDTTLRDGEQAAGAAMTAQQKMEIALQLERLGVDVIEAGFPAASIAEKKVVSEIAGRIKDSKIAVFSRCTKKDIEEAGESLRNAQSNRIQVAVPISDIHIKHKMMKSRENVLEITRDSVAYTSKFCEDPAWIGIDSMRSDFDFMCQVVETAINSGAKTVSLADTVGIATPGDIIKRITYLFEKVPSLDKSVLSIHCHDDLGLSLANSLAAVESGAREVQCTLNGLGDRAGNTPLEELVMAVKVRQDCYPYSIGVDTTQLKSTSQLVSDISGFVVPPNKAVVGDNIFAHGSGIHQAAVLNNPLTYEIFTPQTVGVDARKIHIGPHSGIKGLQYKLETLGVFLETEQLNKVFIEMKEVTQGKKNVSDEELLSITKVVSL
jgi:2-isopropylmalate synthase